MKRLPPDQWVSTEKAIAELPPHWTILEKEIDRSRSIPARVYVTFAIVHEGEISIGRAEYWLDGWIEPGWSVDPESGVSGITREWLRTLLVMLEK